MNLSPRYLISMLIEKGFEFKRSAGSHHIYSNVDTGKIVVVPVHGNRDLKKGTFLGILKQAGIELRT